MMKLADHPNVMRLIEIYEGEKFIYCVLEYFKGKRIFDYIQKVRVIPELHALYIIKQVLIGIKYLHDKGLVHRDIKLENVMFKTSEPHSVVGLIDLGFTVFEKNCMFLTP